jgi:hypothetical protein
MLHTHLFIYMLLLREDICKAWESSKKAIFFHKSMSVVYTRTMTLFPSCLSTLRAFIHSVGHSSLLVEMRRFRYTQIFLQLPSKGHKFPTKTQKIAVANVCSVFWSTDLHNQVTQWKRLNTRSARIRTESEGLPMQCGELASLNSIQQSPRHIPTLFLDSLT